MSERLDTGNPRDGIKLDRDNEMHCKECGIALPWEAVFLHDYERCPECELQKVRRELLAVFGSLEATDLAPSAVVSEIEEVTA